MRRAAIVLVLPALAFGLTGCGARSSTPFTAKGTISCLKDKGFRVTTDPARVGFIAAFAANGGVQAISQSGNTVTVAFTKDTTTVDGTAAAFRAHSSAVLRPHFSDVLRTNRNVVMVWTTTPSSADDGALQGCLAP